MREKNKYLKNKKGSVAVEFSLVAIIFFTFIFGIMEAGKIFWTQNSMQYAIEMASREMIVNEDITESEISAFVEETLGDMRITPSPLNTTTTIIEDDGITYIEIEASYDYTVMVSTLLPSSMSSFTLNAYIRRPLIWGES